MSSEPKEHSEHTVSNRTALLSILTGKISIGPVYQYLWLIATTVSAFYGVIFLLNSLGIEFLALIRGQGMVKFLVNIVVFGKQIDLMIFGISLLLVSLASFLLVRDRMVLKISRAFLVLPLGLIILNGIEVGSVIRWITGGFIPGSPFTDSSWNISFLEMQFANVLYPWAPRIMLLFLFARLFRFLLRFYQEPVRKLVSRISLGSERKGDDRVAHGAERGLNIPSSKILLTIGLLLAVFIALYPYLPAVNSNNRLIGVDTPFYLEKLRLTEGSSIFDALSVALSDDRTLLHLFNYFLSYIVQDATLVMKVLPAILAVLLVLSTFLFVRVATRNSYLAGLSALFTPLAFQQMVGMNAGFYANWLALVEANLFFYFFLKALRDKKSALFATATIMSVFILFTHPWTWFVLMFSVSTFIAIEVLTKSSRIKESFLMVTLLAVNILADLIKGAAFPSVGAGTRAVYTSLIPSLRVPDLPIIIGVLSGTLTTFLGGVFQNLPLLILATIGFVSIGSYRDRFNRLLLSLAFTGLVGVFFFSSNFEMYLQARALYVVPFQVFAALGLAALVKLLSQVTTYVKLPDLYSQAFAVTLVIFITTAMLNHTLRMASTLYPYVV